MESANAVPPRASTQSMRLMLYIAGVLVFLIGIPLFLLTEQTQSYFAWTISSHLTAAFLGASYWSSCVLEIVAARQRLWASARVAVPAVLLFTALTLVISLLHLDKFHFDSPAWHTRAGTWAWMVVYALVPLVLSYLLIAQWVRPGPDPARRARLSMGILLILGSQAVLFIPLGIGLLVAPTTVAGLWPWALTPLTGRAIGAWLVGIGVAAAHGVYENDVKRIRPLSWSSFVMGLLHLVALARYPGEVVWTEMKLWLYVGFLLSMVAVGLMGFRQSRTR